MGLRQQLHSEKIQRIAADDRVGERTDEKRGKTEDGSKIKEVYF